MFNTIHTKLQMDFDGVEGVEELINKIDTIIFAMTFFGYRHYFEHVGFGEDN